MEIEIYSGFNRFNYTKSDDKIVESDSTPKEANGSSTSKIEVVTTMEDLQTSLEIDASLKVGYSVYSAEAKSRYVHSLKLTTNTVTVLIYGKNAKKYVSNGNLIIPEEKLINLEKGNEANNFIAKYGDSYVSSVTKGGEFFVTFTFYAQSQEEKEEVEASLDASGVAGGVEIDGSFSMKISNALKNSNVQYSINSSINGFGSDLTLPKFINPEQFSKEIVDFALSFSSREPTIPTTLDFELKSYHDSGLLTQFKQQFENVKNNTSKFLKSYPNPGWAEKLKELQEVLNTTLDFKRTFDNYNYSDKDLDRKHKQLRADISSLKDFINEVASNPNLKYEELILESYDYGIPEMQYILRKVPGNFMSGAAGGTIFQDVNRSDIPRNMRLIAFQIRKGNIVNCITTFYRKKSPKIDSQEESIQVFKHGGNEGHEQTKFELSPTEYITSFKGWLGEFLANLFVGEFRIETNKNNAFETSNYNEQHVKFTWEANPGDIMVGFEGSNGDFLHSLKPIYLNFEPIRWKERF